MMLKKKTIISITTLIFVITAAFFIVGFILYNNVSNSYEDSDADLLLGVNKSLDMNSIFLQKNEISPVSTKYSALFRDENKRHMYIFAAPVREFLNNNYYLLNNKIEIINGSYGTNNTNFNVTFNNNNITMTNMDLKYSLNFNRDLNVQHEEKYRNIYNQTVEAVKYKNVAPNIDMISLPTYNGLMVEFDMSGKPDSNSIELEIDIGNLNFANDDAGYVNILNGDDKVNDKVGVVYQGIVVDNANRYYPANKTMIYSKNKKNYLQIDLSKLTEDIEYPIKLSVNLDFYMEKMFYDTSVYQDTPKINTVLNNISIFDAINEKHDGYTYIKYNLSSFTPKDSSMLDSLTYSFYVMNVVNKVEIEVFRVKHDWCSWLINWEKKPDYGAKVGQFTVSEAGWHTLDLTEYAKSLIDNQYDHLLNNSIVFKVKSNTNGYALIASMDNSNMAQYFEVKYRVP